MRNTNLNSILKTIITSSFEVMFIFNCNNIYEVKCILPEVNKIDEI